MFVIVGPEFGPLVTRKGMSIDKSLYELKTLSARIHKHLSGQLKTMEYQPSKSLAKLWLKKMEEHCEYIAKYVDSIIIFSKDPSNIMSECKKSYVMKASGTPEYYLEGNVI